MDYEVNEETLAIIPYGKNKSRVIEYDDEYIFNREPFSIMEYSCEYFGSSLEGRMIGSKSMLGTVYRVPLIIEETKSLIFFPTKSPNSVTNIWISLNNIASYRKLDKKTLIIFKNNKELLLDVPYSSIDNQILRATRLECLSKARKNVKKND